mgnify:CR=1 FL=1
MSAIYSSTEQTAAMVAGNAAANGAKDAAFLSSWQTAIGADAKVVLYRDAVAVYTGAISGNVPIVGSAFVIETATQSSISASDIDTGSWELRIEKASDAAVYFGCTVTRAGGTNVGALDDDLEGGDTLTIGAPFVQGAAVQAEVIDQIKGEKVIHYVKRRRKHSSQRTKGHRQHLTLVRVTEVLANGAEKSGVNAATGTADARRAAHNTAPAAAAEAPAKPKRAAKAAAAKE